jgi:hypothetical protein
MLVLIEAPVLGVKMAKSSAIASAVLILQAGPGCGVSAGLGAGRIY